MFTNIKCTQVYFFQSEIEGHAAFHTRMRHNGNILLWKSSVILKKLSLWCQILITCQWICFTESMALEIIWFNTWFFIIPRNAINLLPCQWQCQLSPPTETWFFFVDVSFSYFKEAIKFFMLACVAYKNIGFALVFLVWFYYFLLHFFLFLFLFFKC